MKLRFLPVLLFPFLLNALNAQTLISSTFLGSRTKTQLNNQFGLPICQYDVRFYRITYTTTDVHGQPDTVSGLVAYPNDPTKVFPRLVYQHGTAGSKLDVPSYNAAQSGGEGSIGLLFAGLGFVSVLPDYLGLGVSDGFHPYVHAESEASVALDLLRSLPAFTAQFGVHTNEQLFITGYSQGGHAAMALHRKIEKDLKDEFTVTAAAHLSGPYSIGEVMRNLILSDNIYYFPAYLPNTILSYQTVYGNLFNQISDVFKAPYADLISQFYNGTLSLNSLNQQLIALLITNEGASRPLRMFQADILQQVNADPDHPFNVALRANNVYAWAPVAPTRIFYCMADDQVPFLNSIVARDSMLARGATSLVAQDVNSTADHGGCVNPALTNTIFFFLGLQQTGVFVSDHEAQVSVFELQPNPAGSWVSLEQLPESGTLTIWTADGKLQYESAGAERRLDVSNWDNGLYVVRFKNAGQNWLSKLVVRH